MLINKTFSSFSFLFASCLAIFFMISCGVVPKDYPPGKPFVYETNIKVEGNYSKEVKDQLESQLKGQLDDSIRVRTIAQLYRSLLRRPPVYDSANADKSVRFMNALLRSQGYFRDSIYYDTTLRIRPDNPPQMRTTVNFTVLPGKQVVLDSIWYTWQRPELKLIADEKLQNSYLKKGVPFSKHTISQEMDRLVDLFRQNGYMQFSREDIIGVWDTLDVALLRPSVDPFEQILILDSIRKKRSEKPTANLEIRLRPGYNEDHLRKYYVGRTRIYPDYSADTADLNRNEFSLKNSNSYDFVTYRDIFKPHFIAQNVYFKRGDLYNQTRFIKTVSRFNSLGAWRLVNIETHQRPESDTVDFSLFLTPADKYSFTANLEGSRNSSNSLIFEENVLGIGLNLQLLNRNFGRSSNQSTSTIRYATEVDTRGEFVRTRQASISHSILFPKPIPNVRWIPELFRDNFRSVLSFSLGNIERRDFFNLTSLNASWGYNFQWKNKSASIKIPNIEYAFLNPRPLLDTIFKNTPSFRNIFNTGLVLSVQGGLQIRGGKGRVSQIFRTNVEFSGLLTRFINLKVLDSLYRFMKFDAEFIRNVKIGRSNFILRGYAGAGFALATRFRTQNLNLPFFKQFSAGGPNSMRAWGLRTLGPGATLKTRNEAPFRFGDIQIEANAEYRFPLTNVAGFNVYSCLFADFGNVWFRKQNPDFPNGNFTFSNFLRDLGVNIGTGLRIDFEFFLLRFDYGVKIKNPSPDPSNAANQFKWFSEFKPLGGIVQIGINYPFAF